MFLLRLVVFALATSLLAAPASVRAGEVTLGVNQAVGGNSNLVQGVPERVPDGFYEIQPTIRIEENREELNYDFDYGPRYDAYFANPDLSGWNHFFTGNLDYLATPRDLFSLTGVVRKQQFLTTDVDAGEVIAPDVVAPGVGDVGRYRVSVLYRRSMTPRVSSGTGGSYEQWTYSNERNIPNISGTGFVDLQYAVRPNILFGGSVRGTYRAFEERGIRPPSSTTVGNVDLMMEWQPETSWSLRGSIGPAWLRNRQDDPAAREVQRYNLGVSSNGTVVAAPWARGADPAGSNCPGTFQLLRACLLQDGDTVLLLGPDVAFDQVTRDFAPGEETTAVDTDTFTFFASIGIEKDWGPRWESELRYDRSQDASGGIATTRILDTVYGRVTHTPFRHTRVSLSTSFSRRSSDSTVTFGLPVAQADSDGNTTDAGDLLAEAGPLVVIRADQEIDTKLVSVKFTASHSLAENLILSAEFNYLDQWTDSRFEDSTTGGGVTLTSSRFTRFLGRLVLRYEFDPYRF